MGYAEQSEVTPGLIRKIKKLEQQLKETQAKLDKIKEYALDRWVSQKMWDELEKEIKDA